MEIIVTVALLFIVIGIVFTEFKGVDIDKWVKDCLKKHKGDAKRMRACEVSTKHLLRNGMEKFIKFH